jgi:hypothetical protein
VRLDRLDQLKNQYDPIENRTRDLPACSVVPQLTTLRRAYFHIIVYRETEPYLKMKLIHQINPSRQEPGTWR